MRKLSRAVTKSQYPKYFQYRKGTASKYTFEDTVKASGAPYKDARGTVYQRFSNGMIRCVKEAVIANKILPVQIT